MMAVVRSRGPSLGVQRPATVHPEAQRLDRLLHRCMRRPSLRKHHPHILLVWQTLRARSAGPVPAVRPVVSC